MGPTTQDCKQKQATEIAPALLYTWEACAMLRISKWELYKRIRSREIESIKIGRSRRIPVSAVYEFVEQKRQEEFA